MITDSKCWIEKWEALKLRGIDGSKVGVKPCEHPGAVTFDIVCDMCRETMTSNISDPSRFDRVTYCKPCRQRILHALWITDKLIRLCPQNEG